MSQYPTFTHVEVGQCACRDSPKIGEAHLAVMSTPVPEVFKIFSLYRYFILRGLAKLKLSEPEIDGVLGSPNLESLKRIRHGV